MKSRLSWHIVGIITRGEGDYPESVKNLRFACRLEDDNPALWRELSNVQCLDEQYNGVLESRAKLYDLRPDIEANVHGLATAHFMVGNYKAAALLAEHCLTTMMLPSLASDKPKANESVWERKVANMEQILFITHCYEKMDEFEFALTFLLNHEEHFTHKITLWEYAARLNVYIGNHEAAITYFKKLLARYGENQNVLFGLLSSIFCTADESVKEKFKQIGFGPVSAPHLSASQQSPSVVLSCPAFHPYASKTKQWTNVPLHVRFPSFFNKLSSVELGWKSFDSHEDGGRTFVLRTINDKLTPDLREYLMKVLTQLQEEFPKANCIARSKMLFASAEQKGEIENFIKGFLRKGVPASAVVSMLQAMVTVNGLKALVESILHNFVIRLRRECRSFEESPSENDTAEETTDVLVSSLSVYAAFLDFLGRHDEAHAFVDEALSLAPTDVDLYALKGRIAKHDGQFRFAAQLHEEARSMDLADKHLNVRATRYWLRAGETEIARNLIHMFPGDAAKLPNLHENQVLWWELKMGNALIKRHLKGDISKEGDSEGTTLGRGLRMLNHSMDHFDDHVEKSMEFHPYILRNGFNISYVQFADGVKRLRAHQSYIQPAVNLISTYLTLARGSISIPEKPSASSASKKAKKEEKKKPAPANPEDDETPAPPKVEIDFDGELLLNRDCEVSAREFYLNRCLAIANHLRAKASESLKAQLAVADVYITAKKLVLAVQALNRCINLTGSVDHPQIAILIVNLLKSLQVSEDINPTVSKVIESSLKNHVENFSMSEIGATIDDLKKMIAEKSVKCIKWYQSALMLSETPLPEINDCIFQNATYTMIDQTMNVLQFDLKAPSDYVRGFSEKASQKFPKADRLRVVLGQSIDALPLDPSANAAPSLK
eukprot:GDKJ01018731.1.p1 GENE.GDKJ01018731.1~~GDKJ01018731.1.p1  ORF type:complete len:973 (-),score=270.28 GDKJ01018731.1:57-2729(-)